VIRRFAGAEKFIEFLASRTMSALAPVGDVDAEEGWTEEKEAKFQEDILKEIASSAPPPNNKFHLQIAKLLAKGRKQDFKKAKRLWNPQDQLENSGLVSKPTGRLIVCTANYYNYAIDMIIRLGKKPTRYQLLEVLNNHYRMDVYSAVGLLADDLFVPEHCASCNVSDTELSRELHCCTRCHNVLYCGPACQKSHWKSTHKKECIKAKAEKKPWRSIRSI